MDRLDRDRYHRGGVDIRCHGRDRRWRGLGRPVLRDEATGLLQRPAGRLFRAAVGYAVLLRRLLQSHAIWGLLSRLFVVLQRRRHAQTAAARNQTWVPKTPKHILSVANDMWWSQEVHFFLSSLFSGSKTAPTFIRSHPSKDWWPDLNFFFPFYNRQQGRFRIRIATL